MQDDISAGETETFREVALLHAVSSGEWIWLIQDNFNTGREESLSETSEPINSIS